MSNLTTIDITASETLTVREEGDVILLTNHLRRQALELGMSALSQTKLSTAASELARNMLVHAGGGSVQLEQIGRGRQTGIRLYFADEGPGIANVELAMQSGYSTSTGMGLGLPGAKQLSDEFQLTSSPEKGTRVMIVKWTND